MVWVAHASRGDTSQQFTATLALVCSGFSLLGWCFHDRYFADTPPSTIFLLLLLTRFVALFAQPLLEDDHFRYLWDGFITSTTGSPYAHPPANYFADRSVPVAMQAALNGINHPDIPTIYGPVLQLLFAVGFWIAPGALWPFKVLLFLSETLVLVLLISRRVSPRWLLLWVLHPLLLKESAISAHPDMLIGAALLAATVTWRDGRESTAASLATLAVAMKISAIIALPFFLFTRRGRISTRALIAATLMLIACYLPFFSGDGELGAIGAFGSQWTFNPLLFRFFALTTDDTKARFAVVLIFSLAWFVVSAR
jgi:alpha-1,6-mannosyltransferase